MLALVDEERTAEQYARLAGRELGELVSLREHGVGALLAGLGHLAWFGGVADHPDLEHAMTERRWSGQCWGPATSRVTLRRSR